MRLLLQGLILSDGFCAENDCAPHPSRFMAAHAAEELSLGEIVLTPCCLTNLL